MTKVGEQLLQPESGWKRYDTDKNINYIGTWARESDERFYNKSIIYSGTNGDSIKFNFTGTKIRIIGITDGGRPNELIIKIDGISNTFSELGLCAYNSLVYEKNGLSDCEHSVEIIMNNISKHSLFIFNSTDIDEKGIIKPYNEKLPTQINSNVNSIDIYKKVYINKKYQLNYNIYKPCINLNKTETNIIVDNISETLGNGKMFSLSIDTSKWKNISNVTIK